jgi:hypothetical protein
MRLHGCLALSLLLIFSDRITAVSCNLVEKEKSLKFEADDVIQSGLYNSSIAGAEVFSALSGDSKHRQNIDRLNV